MKEKSRVTFSVTQDFWVEGGYGGNKRKGEMNYKETRSVAGGSPVTEDYRKGEPP